MLATVILAGVASLCFGVSDFFGAVAARSLRTLPATMAIYTASAVAIAILLPFLGGTWHGETLIWGSVAAVLAVAGLLTFYAALAAGPISLAAPLIAILGALVPVAVAIALGEQLVVQAWLAIAMAVASALLISLVRRQGVKHISAQTVLLSIVSGVTLGLSLVALASAPSDSGINVVGVELIAGAGLLGMVVLANRGSAGIRRLLAVLDQEDHEGHMPTRRNAVMLSVGAGALLAGGNSLAVIALQSGSLAVVAVIIGLYPLSTIVLARLVYHEKLGLLQLAGVGLGLTAAVILALS